MKFVYMSSTYPLFLGLFLKNNGEEVHFLYSRKIYGEVFDMLSVKATYVPVLTVYDYVFRPLKIYRLLDRFVKLIDNNDFVFSHLHFASFLFLLIKRLSEKTNIYFYDLEPKVQNQFSFWDIIHNYKSFVKAFLTKLSFKLFYKTKVFINFYSKVFFVSLSEKYLKSLGVNFVDQNMTFEEMQFEVVRKTQFKTKKIKNLYIAQNEIEMMGSVLDGKGVSELKRVIKQYKVAVKPHPSGYPYPESSEIIPATIPSEFLFNAVTNSIISINSTTLISASHFFWKNKHKNVKVVSLMNVVPILEEQSHKEMQQRMKERCKPNVLYPETFDEVIELIK